MIKLVKVFHKLFFTVFIELILFFICFTVELSGRIGVNEENQRALILSYIDQFGENYPMQIGQDFDDRAKEQMLIYLV